MQVAKHAGQNDRLQVGEEIGALRLEAVETIRSRKKLDAQDLGSGELTIVDNSGNPVRGDDLKKMWRNDKLAVGVTTADFNFSSYFVYSEGFSRCQALVMWDPVKSIAAIGHFNPQTDPYYMLEGHTYGPFGGFNKNVPIASKVFDSPQSVRLAHVFGASYSFPENWVESALKRNGFTQPVAHLKVDSSWRDVGLNALNGELFARRSDRSYPSGFKLVGLPKL